VGVLVAVGVKVGVLVRVALAVMVGVAVAVAVGSSPPPGPQEVRSNTRQASRSRRLVQIEDEGRRGIGSMIIQARTAGRGAKGPCACSRLQTG